MTETKDVPIRDASTVIVMRDKATRPRLLMGQRGAKAAFMPNKFVFPGGAVDKGDAHIPLFSRLDNLLIVRRDERKSTNDHNDTPVALRKAWPAQLRKSHASHRIPP